MAAIEMYDYLSAVTPGYAGTLSVTPQETMVEEAVRLQEVHEGDDGSEEIVNLSSTNIFYVSLHWNIMNESDSGTVWDFWLSSTKGNGMATSFVWEHPTDGHSYVVRFRAPPQRSLMSAPDNFAVTGAKLKVIGRIND